MSYKQFSKDLNANGFSYHKQMAMFSRIEHGQLESWYNSYWKLRRENDDDFLQDALLQMTTRFNAVYQENNVELHLVSAIPRNIYLYNPLVGGYTLTCPNPYITTMITAVGSAIESVGQLRLSDIVGSVYRSKAELKQFDDGKLTAVVRKVKTHSETLGVLLPGKPLAEPLADSREITEVLLYSTYEDGIMDLVHEFRNPSKQAISTNLDFDLEVLCL